MLDWIKKFLNPKTMITRSIDALDYLVPILAAEIEKIKERFAAMDSTEKAQWCVDLTQDWLRKRFKIS